MEFVSSDTNVWIDFSVIKRTALPFKLPYTYIMNNDAIKDELLSPVGLTDELILCGLVGVDITMEEFEFAEAYGAKYVKLSVYDRIALSIAKNRGIILMTGDGALRKAAFEEGVDFIGTIGVLDQLYENGLIEINEYRFCLVELQKKNGYEVRLPKNELSIRLQRLSDE